MNTKLDTCKDCRIEKACWDCIQLTSYLDVARVECAERAEAAKHRLVA